MELEMLLITGRTRKQGLGLVQGKYSSTYTEEINRIGVSKTDLEALGAAGDKELQVISDFGMITGTAREDEGLPAGMVFVPQGPLANQLIGGDTQGTGMPDFKGLKVRVRLA